MSSGGEGMCCLTLGTRVGSVSKSTVPVRTSGQAWCIAEKARLVGSQVKVYGFLGAGIKSNDGSYFQINMGVFRLPNESRRWPVGIIPKCDITDVYYQI